MLHGLEKNSPEPHTPTSFEQLLKSIISYLKKVRDPFSDNEFLEYLPSEIVRLISSYSRSMSTYHAYKDNQENITKLRGEIETYVILHQKEAVVGLSQPGLSPEEQQLLIRTICDLLPNAARRLFREVQADKTVNIDSQLWVYAFSYLSEKGK